MAPRRPEGTTADVSAFQERFHLIRDNMRLAVKGKRAVVETLILAVVCGGHVIITDVPGVGKTSLGKALARSLHADFGRIQFTPDLLPADLTGVPVLDRATGTLEFRPGPLFSNIVLADEINRAPPKTQSALLEAMGEQQVTVDGVTRRLRSPFTVIATLNPVEHEGAYPLPDSQLDRFLMSVDVGYPDRDSEDEILRTRKSGEPVDTLEPVAGIAELRAMSELLDEVHVSVGLRSYLLDIVEATRRHPSLMLGLSPRGALAVLRAARGRAASRGRLFVTPDDIKAVAPLTIPHRLLLAAETQMRGLRASEVLSEVVASVPVPRVARSGGPGRR